MLSIILKSDLSYKIKQEFFQADNLALLVDAPAPAESLLHNLEQTARAISLCMNSH